MTIARVITSAVYDSADSDAKIISFEYNLYDSVPNEEGDTKTYIGGFAVGETQAVHMATCDAYCDPLGSAYVSTMSMAIKAGTAVKTDLTLTDVSTSSTNTAGDVTRHTEYYKLT